MHRQLMTAQDHVSSRRSAAKSLAILMSVAASCAIGCGGAAVAKDKSAAPPDSPFLVTPYVQLGNNPHEAKKEKEEIHWFSKAINPRFKVTYQSDGEKGWSNGSAVKSFEVPATGIEGLKHFYCEVTNLEPGKKFAYKVSDDGKVVFESSSTARKGPNEKTHVVIFGDCGAGSDAQKKVAVLTSNEKPDMLIIPGDIAYNYGIFSDYLRNFFPQYTVQHADPADGAPVMQTIPIIPVLGNHDVGHITKAQKIDLSRMQDALAYYYIWSTPHNGPLNKRGVQNIPEITGGQKYEDAFLKSAGDNYPAEGNYSFDNGNAHWTILDANVYMNWSDKELRDWVRNDIRSAKNMTWKFVVFHQPGFSIDREHSREQRMRLLSDLFQEEGVDVVWAGHSHNYQRTKAFIFKPTMKDGVPAMNPDGTVTGEISINKDFDGVKDTNPRGIVYIVTGGGGAQLYNASESEIQQYPWLEKFVGDIHSFTVADIDKDKLSVKQISEDGKTLDEFSISKAKVLAPAGK